MNELTVYSAETRRVIDFFKRKLTFKRSSSHLFSVTQSYLRVKDFQSISSFGHQFKGVTTVEVLPK